MASWTEKRRAGGGPPEPNRMINGVLDGTTTIEVTYLRAVTASTLNPNDFFTGPSNTTPDTVAQASPNLITLTFPTDISTDATVN